MNIKILDSWLREFLKTSAKPKQIAEKLSLTSVSIEKIEKFGDDFVYDIEVTTNRPDLMSVTGIAKEGSAILPQFGIKADFVKHQHKKCEANPKEKITIKNNPSLVNRICAVVISVKLGDSPKYIKERLEGSGIRSLNNVIDITNYVMREIGHPTHAFDYDRLATKQLIIREARAGEKVITLDGKVHVLKGGDIIADDGEGKIVDLLGVMGTENSVVTNNTKRILFFIDNNDPVRIRRTSMELAVRTEAAVLNEKSVDPDKAWDALLRGIELYKKEAGGEILSELIDIYPNKPKKNTINVRLSKINSVMGVDVPFDKVKNILSSLGFIVSGKGQVLTVEVPSSRLQDIQIEEDIIEEVARIYGYHNIPSRVAVSSAKPSPFATYFYWEKRAREALKYWGFTEVYTNSMVSRKLFEGPEEKAVSIQNPLTEDYLFMRRTLVPSILNVLFENKANESLRIFEMSNIYLEKKSDLPNEVMTLGGVIKKKDASFYEVKGIIEQLLNDLGIKKIEFKNSKKGGFGASLFIEKEYVGEIEVLYNDVIDFELNFELITKYATLKKVYKPISQFPPVVEDLSFVVDYEITTQDLINAIKSQNSLIADVSLLDQFADSRTFHIVYRDLSKNLTTEEVSKIRGKITALLKEKFSAKIK